MNRGQLRTRLQALGYGTDTATAQNEMLNAAYETVAGLRRWPWLEHDDATFATTAGVFFVSLGGVFSEPLMWVDAVRLQQGTTYLDLEYLPPQEFRSLQHVDRDQGVPQYWTEIKNELRFFPCPDRAYTLWIDYIKRPALMDDDTDTPLFDSEFHEVLVWHAAAQMGYRERDLASADFAQNQFDRQLASMMGAYGVRQRQTAREVPHNRNKWRDWNGR